MGVFLKKLVKNAQKETLEARLLRDIKAVGLPIPEMQYKWHPDRLFMADYAYPHIKLLIECDGGQWQRNTGHNSGTGKDRDCEKDIEAIFHGWKIFRFPTSMIMDGRAIAYLEKFFDGYK